MKFSVEKDHLLKFINIVIRATQSKLTSGGIRSSIKLQLKNDSLRLSASDLDISIETSLDVNGAQDGTVVVPGKVIQDIVRSFKPGSITFNSDADSLFIVNDTVKFEIKVYNNDTFIPIQNIEGKSETLPSIELSKAIFQVGKAASNDEIRPVLTGILLSFNEKKLRLVATDSYRLAIKEIDINNNELNGISVLVPAKALNEVEKIMSAVPEVELINLTVDEGHVKFTIGDTQVITQLINETFPLYEKLIPEDISQKITINKENLEDAIKRMKLFVKDLKSSVLISESENGIKMSASSFDFGSGEEVIDAELTGGELQISFNPNYLLDGIETIEEEETEILISTPKKPVLIKALSSDQFKYILMPITVA
jgi:DNA polymerase-3 subunit beta